MQRIKLTGFKELEKALFQLGQKEAKRVGRATVRKAAKPILDMARGLVPVDQGRLKKALTLRVDTLKFDRSVMSAMVYVKRTDYRPAKTKRARYSYQIGSMPKVYGAFLEFGIPGLSARPFMRPAWDALGGMTALTRIGQELGPAIEREAAKLRR